MKRTLSLLLALVLALSVCGVSAFAVATPLTGGSSKAAATNIPNYGVDYVSSLDTAGEVDWFKFTTLSEDAYYYISLKNYDLYTSGGDYWALNLYFYDTYSQELGHFSVSKNSSSSINLRLETNTIYYIQVLMGNGERNSTGNYQLNVRYTLDNVKNTMEGATSIPLNTVLNYSLDGSGDVDWYQFTTAPVQAEYTVTLKDYNIYTSGGDYWALNIYLVDKYKQELGHISVGQNSQKSFKVTLDASTTYYINVLMGNGERNSTGNYEFTVTTDAVTKTLQSIAVTSQPSKTTYQVGESFQSAGMVVKATYTDSSSATVTNYTVTGFNPNQTGTQTLTVTYAEGNIIKTATFYVTVVPNRTLASIRVQSYPNKTEYQYGEAFNQSGMVVRATYTDNSTANVTGFTVSGYNATLPGNQTLTVSYTEGGVTKTANFTVTVLANPVLTGITIVSEPFKTTYELGETLDMTGFALNGIYSDGSAKRITNYQVSGFDSSTAGQKVVSVSVQDGYTVFTQTFTVTVNAKQADTADGLQRFLTFLRNVWTPLVKVVKLVLTLFSSLLNAIQ